MSAQQCEDWCISNGHFCKTTTATATTAEWDTWTTCFNHLINTIIIMVEVCVFCEADIDGSHLHHTYARDLWSTLIRCDALQCHTQTYTRCVIYFLLTITLNLSFPLTWFIFACFMILMLMRLPHSIPLCRTSLSLSLYLFWAHHVFHTHSFQLNYEYHMS